MPEQRRSSSRTGSTPAGGSTPESSPTGEGGTAEGGGPGGERGESAEASAQPDHAPANDTGTTAGSLKGRPGIAGEIRKFIARRTVVACGGLAIVVVAVAAAVFTLTAPELPGGEAVVEVPQGATFREVVGILEGEQVVGRPTVFRIYARLRGLDGSVKAGTYRLWRGAPYGEVLGILTDGKVVTYPMTIPEGWTLDAMAGRIAAAAGSDSVTVAEILDGASDSDWNVPGPGIEGYLFPDTYRFAEGVGVERVIAAMVDGYRGYWTPERRELLAASGMTEQEVVTLGSIVQAESGNAREMPTISSVYHNRLRVGMLLQADPTVQYALTESFGGRRSRLLYAAIDSVADHPYSTYHRPGLPPGPIGAPGAAALDAALAPDSTDYLYFVAGPDGSHIFSRSLREHNNAINRIRGRRQGSG
ncbi:MAG: endolytic transglycosylase MltG [Gemmatimonadetes bacterium]|nr:endolytic transglycosylase MltG [Gemmatimonadota bacterium]